MLGNAAANALVHSVLSFGSNPNVRLAVYSNLVHNVVTVSALLSLYHTLIIASNSDASTKKIFG